MRGTADSARGRRPERFAAALGRPLGNFGLAGRPASGRPGGRPVRRTGRGPVRAGGRPVRRAGGRPVRRAGGLRSCGGRAGVRAGSLAGVSSLTESVRRARARVRRPAIAGIRLRRRVPRDRTRIRRAAVADIGRRRPAGRRILISAPAVIRAGAGAVTGRTSESGWREPARWPGISAISRRAGEGGRPGYPALRAGLVRISSLDPLGRPCSQRDGSRRLGPTVAPGFPFTGVLVFALFPAAPVSTVLTRGTRPPAGATCQRTAIACRETSGIGITTGHAAAMTQVAVPVVLLVAVKAGIRLPGPARLRLCLAGLLLGPVFLPRTPRIPEALAGRPGIVLRHTRPAQLLLVLRPSAAHEPSHS